MELVRQLQEQLKIEWTKAMTAKRQDEVQRLRAQALNTYKQLKFQLELTKGQ